MHLGTLILLKMSEPLEIPTFSKMNWTFLHLDIIPPLYKPSYQFVQWNIRNGWKHSKRSKPVFTSICYYPRLRPTSCLTTPLPLHHSPILFLFPRIFKHFSSAFIDIQRLTSNILINFKVNSQQFPIGGDSEEQAGAGAGMGHRRRHGRRTVDLNKDFLKEETKLSFLLRIISPLLFSCKNRVTWLIFKP